MSASLWLRVLVLSLVCGLGLIPAPIPAQAGPPDDLFRGAEREWVERETRRLSQIQLRHQDSLLKLPKVHGMGISVDLTSRELVFLVAVEPGGEAPPIPAQIEGVRVVIERSLPAEPLNGGSGCMPCHSDQVPLPVPMGNSTGNAYLCSACTLGFKACRDGVHYYVTNAHCSFDSNGCEGGAPIGSNTYHRGQLDASCTLTSVIGTVDSHAVPQCGVDNRVDAALMLSSNTRTSWSIRDIGAPSVTPRNVVVGDVVQKSGRTTGLTFGTVAVTNYTTLVGPYCCGNASFVGQIRISANVAPFAQGGDSGSGVLDRSSPPRLVGLLFAAARDGSYGVANRIDDVLASLNLSLDPYCESCLDQCDRAYNSCIETNCYWDYNWYMCDHGCYYEHESCVASCG
jgi:hypothetical protein